MKTSYLLSLSIIVGLMTTVVGAVVSADDAKPVSAIHPSEQPQTAMLTKLNAEPTFSDSTLRRPF